MDDFFNNIETSDANDVISSNDIITHKPKRVDVRYDQKVSTVTQAHQVGDYKIKQWPTLSEEEIQHTNALGISIEDMERRRQQLALEKKEAQRRAEQEAFKAAAQLAEDEVDNAPDESMVMGVSLEELDKIRNDAYEEGKAQGHEEGYKDGLEQGILEGKTQGTEQGLQEGSQKGYQDGLIQGREEGFVKGHNEGIEAGQKIVLEQAEKFRFLADCLANPLREVDKEVTDEIAYIISRLVKVIVHKEITNNSEFLKESIEKAIGILPNAKKGASIYLNPEDLAVVEASIGQDYIKSQNWILKESNDLEVGDIKVENEESEINWRVNDRVDALLEDFLTKVYPSVDSALREHIEGCPEYDELPKKTLAPRNLDDISSSLKDKTDKTPPVAEAEEKANTVDDGTLTDDPAPYMDDYGHPVHVAPDGKLYYFDDNKNKVFVDENGQPVAEEDAQPIQVQ